MKQTTRIRKARKSQEGYALVLMMFFLALLVLSTAVAAPTVISSVQREKEAEMVWRGGQYKRGIRTYYMKMRRFPTSLDNLTKPTNGVRFMRQAYKDPMNTVDGSWRLIYVGPNGQLIGSLNNQFLGMSARTGLGGTNAMQNTALGGSSSSLGTSFGNSGFGGNGNATTVTGSNQTAASGTGDASATDPNAQNGDNSDQTGQPQPLGTMDASNTVGGNIIGVGSKVNKKSFLWYQKAKDYRHFEFIWDPTKDTMNVMGGATKGIGTPIASPPGVGAPGTVAPPPNPNPGQSQNPGNPGNDMPLQAPNQ